MATKKRPMETKAFKFQSDGVDEAGVFSGFASVFGGIDSYKDTVMPGAFKKTLKEHKHFPITWTHDEREPLGIVYLEEDDKGLRVAKGELNMDVQSAREKRSLVKQGAITGMSIGFKTIKYDIKEDGEGRNLREIALFEVALCVFPSDESARIAEIKADGGYESPEQFYEATGPWLEMKPLPNEHGCVLTPVDKYDKFRRGNRDHEGKTYGVIYGHVKGGDDWEDHSFRYPKDSWTAGEAGAHCKTHKGTFEPAAKCQECTFEDGEPQPTPQPPKPQDTAKTADLLRGLTAEFKRLSESFRR